MKKIIMSLSIISTVWFIGCGGGNEEAKELLKRLLKVVGIPHTIVVNICQDGNDNGICEEFEIQAKVTIDKGDSLATILHKVSLTDEGEYFLENYDPTKEIIMEIEDSANVNYNDGKFTFTYNPETQELSILQAMIDAGHLTPSDVNAVREMNNVDDFYKVLLRDFESNLNTLGDNDFSSPRAVNANIKEMADELLASGIVDTLPQNVNDCNGSQTCVDNVLAPVSEELLIDENESVIIKENETADIKSTLANKTFYIPYTINEQQQIEQVTFNSDVTLNTWEVLEGPEQGEKGAESVSIEGSTMTTSDAIITYIRETEDYLVYESSSDGERRLYFDLAKARKYDESLQENEGSTSETNTTEVINGFTKEMLQSKVGYYLAYTEDDGTKGYAKATFLNDTTMKRQEIGVAPNGDIVSDEIFTVSFILEDGKIKHDVGSAYYILVLDNQDDAAWYITMQKDYEKDGTIDETESITFYFSKPSDYPDNL